jgi:hypothetical protein
MCGQRGFDRTKGWQAMQGEVRAKMGGGGMGRREIVRMVGLEGVNLVGEITIWCLYD